MRRGATLGWFVLGLAACNAIAGLDGEFTEGDGGARTLAPEAGGGSTSSGGAGSSSSSSSGATSSSSGSTTSSSSSSSSSGSVVDSGKDTGADTGVDSGPPPPFCTGLTSIFCSDFESATAKPFGWSSTFETTGTLSLADPAGATRGKSALDALLNADVNDNRSVALLKTLPTTALDDDAESLTLDLDFEVKEMSTDYLVIAMFQMNGTEYGLAAYHPRDPRSPCPGAPSNAAANNFCLDETTPSGTPSFTNAVLYPINTWHHATIKVARTPSNYSGQVIYDGVASLNSVSSGAFAKTNAPNSLEIGVGAFYSGFAASARVLVDNVRVTAP
ncbi:MAG: hypothetical protein U0270_36185 [Labilithrix sp.]